MIAKSYIDVINAFFQDSYNKPEVKFILREYTEKSNIKFGDTRNYVIEVWAVNTDKNIKDLIYKTALVSRYEDGKLTKKSETELMHYLWIVTLNNLDRIHRYGAK